MAAINSFDIYSDRGQLRRPLAWSLGLHLAFATFVVLYATFIQGIRGQGWGSGGDWRCHGSNAGERRSLARESNRDHERAGHRIQGTREVRAHGAGKGTGSDSDSRQEYEDNINPRQSRARRNAKPQPEPPESNQIPYGEGGPVSGPYTMTAGGAKGGFGFTGSGGDFGSQFAWYVQAVQRKVTENWLKYEVDPRITEAKRVYLTFDIARDGHPSNVRDRAIQWCSSLDQSAVRALQRIDTFGPLPPDYSGSKVSVEFWFDYKR